MPEGIASHLCLTIATPSQRVTTALAYGLTCSETVVERSGGRTAHCAVQISEQTSQCSFAGPVADPHLGCPNTGTQASEMSLGNMVVMEIRSEDEGS